MTRLACAIALALVVAIPHAPLSAAPLDVQAATKAAPTTPSPAAPAKFYKPVKGVASIEVIQGAPKKIGTNIVTVFKVKNTSQGRIDLMQIDEYWYNQKVEQVSGSMQKYRKPFNPGDIIEITLTSPSKPNLYRNMVMFSHANGKIEAKAVKKFE